MQYALDKLQQVFMKTQLGISAGEPELERWSQAFSLEPELQNIYQLQY